MGKIRKLGEALWYNKERLVFAVMVCILLWHVYGIIYPPPEEEQQVFARPDDSNIDAIIKDLVALPDPPEPRAIVSWDGIYTPNPFWALSAQSSVSARGQDAPVDISLLRIQAVGIGDRYRAQLKTNVVEWYDEGDSFESFQLLEIHPEDNSVKVRSDRLGRVVNLKAQAN